MNTDTLLSNFATIAEAPGGINRLKLMILRLALSGHLTQNTRGNLDEAVNDFDALSEAQKRSGTKKIKITSEQDLDIHAPSEWLCKRLGELVSIRTGFAFKSADYTTTGQRIIRVTDIRPDGTINIADSKFIAQEKVDEKLEKYALEEGDLLVAMVGSLGKIGQVGPDVLPALLNQNMWRIKAFSEQLDTNYLRLVLHDLHDNRLAVTQSALGHLRMGVYASSWVPFPSLPEQERIVTKVNELLTLCDQLEQQQNHRQQSAAKTRTSVLTTLVTAANLEEKAAAFRRFTQSASWLCDLRSIAEIRATIRELAVHGKLTESKSSALSAVDELNELRDQRNQRLLALSESEPEARKMLSKLKKLSPPEPLYPVPPNWTFCRLIDLCEIMVDCHNKTAPYSDSGIPIFRTTNIRDGDIRWADMKYVDEETYRYWSRRCPPQPGDLIFTREAPMGEATIIPEGVTLCLGQRTMLIRPMDEISREYLLTALIEPGLLRRTSKISVGSTVKHFRVGDVENLPIALPPIEEQERIAVQARELLMLCDQLEKRLQLRDQTAEHLTISTTSSLAT